MIAGVFQIWRLARLGKGRTVKGAYIGDMLSPQESERRGRGEGQEQGDGLTV